MKLPKECKIDGCVSEDETREILHHVFTEETEVKDGVRHGVAVATDGRMLARIPIEFEEGDAPGLVPIAAIVAARKTAKPKDESLKFVANGEIKVTQKDGSVLTFGRPEGDYPNYKQVLTTEERTVRIAFNARLLLKLAEALGNDSVILEIGTETEGIAAAIRVRTTKNSDRLGVLMPVRMG